MSPYAPFKVFKVCPKCGSKHFAQKDAKSLLCADCGFTFYINMSAAVVALIWNNKNELLFTTRKYDPAKGMLDLPGGFVDLHESAEDAVKREIKEELNLQVKELSFVASFPNTYIFNGIEYYTLDLVFSCKVDDFNNLQPMDDVCAYSFLAPENIDVKKIGFESIKNVVESLR